MADDAHGRVFDFLEKSGLVNLDAPLSEVVHQARALQMENPGTYFIVGGRILLIVGCSGVVAMGERPRLATGNVRSAEIAMGESDEPPAK